MFVIGKLRLEDNSLFYAIAGTIIFCSSCAFLGSIFWWCDGGLIYRSSKIDGNFANKKLAKKKCREIYSNSVFFEKLRKFFYDLATLQY